MNETQSGHIQIACGLIHNTPKLPATRGKQSKDAEADAAGGLPGTQDGPWRVLGKVTGCAAVVACTFSVGRLDVYIFGNFCLVSG